MQQSRIVVADLNEGSDAVGSQHPFQLFVHLQIAVRSADSRQQHDFATDRSDNLLRRQQNAASLATVGKWRDAF